MLNALHDAVTGTPPEPPAAFHEQLAQMVASGDKLRADYMELMDLHRATQERLHETQGMLVIEKERSAFFKEQHDKVVAKNSLLMQLVEEAEARFSTAIECMTTGRQRAHSAAIMAKQDTESRQGAGLTQEEKDEAAGIIRNLPGNDYN